jgi:hypothetical protein
MNQEQSKDLTIDAAKALLKLAELLVRTRDEMREAIDKMEYLRKVVDGCANTLIDTLREALLIAYANASESEGSELEQPVVGSSGSQTEGGAGTDGDDENRDAI